MAEKAFLERFSAYLESYRQKFEAGDKAALLEAIDLCAAYRLIMPEWVAYHYRKAFIRWNTFEAETLDEAFGVEKPKYFRIDMARRKVNIATEVYLAVLDAERRGLSISNDGAMAEVAEKFGIDKKVVWEYYDEVRHHDPIGKGIEKTRKKASKS